MRIALFLLSLLLGTWGDAASAGNLNESVARTLHGLYPSTVVISAIDGDLDGDGLPDAVAVVQEGGSLTGTTRIVVLRGTKRGGYDLWTSSPDLGYFPKGPPDIEMTRGSLFVHMLFGACCEMEADRLQFKYRKGHLQLIGVNIHADKAGETGAMDHETWDIDLNLLTGERHESHSVEGTTKRVRARVGPFQPRELGDFEGLSPDKDLSAALNFTLR
jgi:hypothetical protein